MQHATRCADRFQKLAQGRDDAAFVQHPHVVDRQIMAEKGRMFRRIDRADAKEANALGRQGRGEGGEGIEPVAPGDIGHGRAVQVARGGGQGGVEIGMGSMSRP